MLNLKQWRKRCEKAQERGNFTPKDVENSLNTCKCAIGECAQIIGSSYGEIKGTVYARSGNGNYRKLLNAEDDFMTAVENDKPKKALTAIRKIEHIVNRIKNEFN